VLCALKQVEDDMASSRTGTTKHKHMRAKAIAKAKREGQTTCPIDGRWIDWDTHGLPSSPEADEIIAYADTGATSTDPDNWRIICLQCNRQLGGQLGAQRSRRSGLLQTSRSW